MTISRWRITYHGHFIFTASLDLGLCFWSLLIWMCLNIPEKKCLRIQYFYLFNEFCSSLASLILFNFQLSYQIVDSLIWLGLRDIINDFRKKKMQIRPVTYLSGSQFSESDVPHVYLWSPYLVPKPKGGDFVLQQHIALFLFLFYYIQF